MSDDLASRVIRDWERMNADRGTFMTHWQDVSDYVQPNRADYYRTRSPGQKRMSKVFDGTPIRANEMFASSLHSLLTSPTLRWLDIRPDDDRIAADYQASAWFDQVTDWMYGLFNSPRHNFASQCYELYCDLGCVGTGIMSVLLDAAGDVLFSTINLRECVIEENEKNRIDRLIRKFTFTARQAVATWDKAAGEKVLKAFDDKPETKFEFLHSVKPRAARDPQRLDAKHKAFESVYVSLADKAVISESGFDEFPYLVPRFSKSTGETWGRSWAMSALPDIKQLNELAKQVVMAAQLQNRPPLNVPDDGYLFPVNVTPGGINKYRAGSKDRVEPWNMNINTSVGADQMRELRQAIMETSYVQWMMMPSDPTDPASSGKGVTATYTLQQRDEKMRLLSPMLARQQGEFLGPLVDRVFAMAWRQSKALAWGPGAWLPRPPAILSGAKYRVDYISPLAIAQKSSELDAVNRLVQTGLLLGQIDPEAPQTLDSEQVMRITAASLRTPTLILKSAQQMQAERAQKAQAAAAQQNSEALANVAGAAQQGTAAVKNLADAGGVVGGNGAVPAMGMAA